MYTNILVPLDTSEMAEQILAYVHLLATSETTIHLVNVLEPNMYSYAFSAKEAAVRDKLQRVLHGDLERYVTEMERNLRQQGLRVETWVAKGDAAQTIADVATKIDADLIAMTTHGRTGIGRWALGSVADRVVHIAQKPILLVHNRAQSSERLAIHRILVPVDGSLLAEEALTHAKKIAAEHDAELLIVRVIEPLSNWQQALLTDDGHRLETIERERRQEAEAYLTTICQQLQNEGLQTACHLYGGTPGNMLLDLLASESIDLIIMTTHGLSGYSRWVYGSVAGKVLHHASCPLLLIRSVEVQNYSVR